MGHRGGGLLLPVRPARLVGARGYQARLVPRRAFSILLAVAFGSGGVKAAFRRRCATARWRSPALTPPPVAFDRERPASFLGSVCWLTRLAGGLESIARS